MIKTFESYKNEIVEEIKELNNKMEVFSDENISIIRFDTSEEGTEENTDEESITIDEYNAGFATIDEITETNKLLSAIVEQQDTIIEQQELISKSVNEGSWVISITIIVALAFHYFVNQLSKW